MQSVVSMGAWLHGRYIQLSIHGFALENSDSIIVHLPDLRCNNNTLWSDGFLRLARLANKSMVPYSRRETACGSQTLGQPNRHRDAQGRSTPRAILHREAIANSTIGFQDQPGSGNSPRPSMLLHLDMCIRIRRRQCRRHKLQPSYHLWLRFQQDQDGAHGHPSSSRSHGRRCNSHSSILQSAKCAVHLMDFFCDRRHDWRHHGSRSECGDTSQCVAGGRLSHGFL